MIQLVYRVEYRGGEIMLSPEEQRKAIRYASFYLSSEVVDLTRAIELAESEALAQELTEQLTVIEQDLETFKVLRDYYNYQ